LNVDVVLDASAKQDEEGSKARQLAEIIWKTSGIDNLKPFESPDKDRPFIPAIVWALFSAYRQILNLPLAQMSVMRTGVSKRVLADSKEILNMAKSALPHQSEFIDKFGTGGLYYLIEELEERLLSEIMTSLESTASDNKSITQAAAILAAVDKVTASSEDKIEIPDRVRSQTQAPPLPKEIAASAPGEPAQARKVI